MSSPPPLSPAPRRWRADRSLVDRLNQLAEGSPSGEQKDVDEVDALLSTTPVRPPTRPASAPKRHDSTRSTASARSVASSLRSTRSSVTLRLKQQPTGESFARAYDDVYASLDALANPFDVASPKVSHPVATPKAVTPKVVDAPHTVRTPKSSTPVMKPASPTVAGSAGGASPESYPMTPAGLEGHGLGIRLGSSTLGGSSRVSTPKSLTVSDAAAVARTFPLPPSLSKSAALSPVTSSPASPAPPKRGLGGLASPLSVSSVAGSFQTALSTHTSPKLSSAAPPAPSRPCSDAPPAPNKSPAKSPSQPKRTTPTKRTGSALDAPAPKRTSPTNTPSKARVSNLMKMFESGSASSSSLTRPAPVGSRGLPGMSASGRSFRSTGSPSGAVSPALTRATGATSPSFSPGRSTPTRVPSATPSARGRGRSVGRVESPPSMLDAPRSSWQVRSALPPPEQLDLGPLKYVPPPTLTRKLSKPSPYGPVGRGRSASSGSAFGSALPTEAVTAAPAAHNPDAQTVPPRSASSSKPATSPVSNVRNMIAAWRARSSSSGGPPPPSFGSVAESLVAQQTGASAASATSAGAIGLGRKQSWNISIRRRRQNEQRKAVVEEEPEDINAERPHSPPITISSGGSKSASGRGSDKSNSSLPPRPANPSPPSIPSVPSGRSSDWQTTQSSLSPSSDSEPTGEPIKTGVLYYLQVHDRPAEEFAWICVDARLYADRLVLKQRLSNGMDHQTTIYLDDCDEVASSPSPTNSRSDDIGAAIARRDRELANQLYPFRLQYEEGQERLGCDSAIERVRWVSAIWGVLDRLSTAQPSRPASSVLSGSSCSQAGSASTRLTLSHSAPQSVVDDAVIPTAGGSAAPLVHRDSKRLKPQRSLRRAASDLDLRADQAEQLTATRSEPSTFLTPMPAKPPTIATYPASTLPGGTIATFPESQRTLQPYPLSEGTTAPTVHAAPTIPPFEPSEPGAVHDDAVSDIGPSISEYGAPASRGSGQRGGSGYAASASTVPSLSLSATAYSGTVEMETIDVNRPMSFPLSAPSEIVIPGATWPPESSRQTGSGSTSGSGSGSGRSSDTSPPGYTSEPYEGPFSEVAVFSMPAQTTGTDAGFTTASGATGTEAGVTEGSSGLPSVTGVSGEKHSLRTPATPTSEYSAWASGDSSDVSLLPVETADEFTSPRPGFLYEFGSPAWSSTVRGQSASGASSPQWTNAQSQHTSATATPRRWGRDLPEGSTSMSVHEGAYHSAQETYPEEKQVVSYANLPPLPPSDSEPSSSGSSGYRTSASHTASRPASHLSRSDAVSRHSTGSSVPSNRSGKPASHRSTHQASDHSSPASVHAPHHSTHSTHRSAQPSEPSSHHSSSGSHSSGPGSHHSRPRSHHSAHHSRPNSYSGPGSHDSGRDSGPGSRHSSSPSSQRSGPSSHHSKSSSHHNGPPSEHSTPGSRHSVPRKAPPRESQQQPYSIQVDVPIPGPPGGPSSSGSSSSRHGSSLPTARSHAGSGRTDEATGSSSSHDQRWSSNSSGTYESASPLMGRLLRDDGPVPPPSAPSSTSSPRPQPITAWAAGIRPPASEAGNQSYYTDPAVPSSASNVTGVAPPNYTAHSTAFTTARGGLSTAGVSLATGRTSMYATAGTAESTAPSELLPPNPPFSAPSIATSDPSSPFGTPPFVSAVPVSPGWSTHRGLPSYAPSEASALPSRPWNARGTTPSIPEQRQRSTTPMSIADVNVADLERMSSVGSSASRFTEMPSQPSSRNGGGSDNPQSSNHSEPSDPRGYRTASTHESYVTGTVAYTTAEGTRYRSVGSTPTPHTAMSLPSTIASSETAMPPSTTSMSSIPSTTTETVSSVPSWVQRRPDYADVERLTETSAPTTIPPPSSVSTLPVSSSAPSTFRNVIPSTLSTQPGSTQPSSTSVPSTKQRTVSGSTSATQASSSQSSDSSSDATTALLRPFLNHGRGDVAMSRLVNRLLAYEDVRDAQAIGMRSQLDRMEKTLNSVAIREPPVREVIIREIERGPPPVPAKDEPSEPSSSSSSSSSTSSSSTATPAPIKKIPRKPPPSLPLTESETETEGTYTVADTGMADAETSSVHSDSSEETAMPTTPQLSNLNLDITSRLDHMDSLFSKVLGQQQMLLDELDRRDPSRFEQLLARVLAMHLGGSGTSSPTSTVRSLWPEGDFYPGAGTMSSKEDPHALHANTVASLGSSSQASEYRYNPSTDPEFRDMPTPLGSEVTPPWMPPPMELPDSVVNRFRQQDQPRQEQPQQAQQPQQTVIYYPQSHAVPGEYPRQPSPQESVPEPFRDADSNDGHGERDVRPIPFTIEREPRTRERPPNAPTFDSDERNNIYRGPTPQEDLGLPTPPQDRQFKNPSLPPTTAVSPVFNRGPGPGSAPLPSMAPASAFTQPPRAQTMPPGPVPARGTPGFVPHIPTSGLRNPYPPANPLRTPARTPMTTPWRRGFGPGWRPPMVRNMNMMQPGLRPGMFPPMPLRPGGLHRRWGSGLDAVDERGSSHGSDVGSVSSSSSKTSKSSKSSTSSKSTSTTVLKKQNEQELAEIEKKRVELEKEQKAFEDAQAKEHTEREAEEAERARADERKRIEDESRARDKELEEKFDEKLEEELDRIKKTHLEAQAAQPSPQPQPPTPIAATPDAPVIHIDVASPHSHKSYRSYPMSRYSSSISSVSPSSASEDAILTPNTNNIQLNEWIQQQQKSGMDPSEERMARYMSGVSEQINNLSAHMKRELDDLILCMNDLRQANRPTRVQARVLSDGTVQLMTGEIVDGIRGESQPGAVRITTAGPHVQGRVLPDGTVMVGDSELEGIRGSPREPETKAEADEVEKRIKDAVQDERLSQLEERRELRTTRPQLTAVRDILSVTQSVYAPSERARSPAQSHRSRLSSHHSSRHSHHSTPHDREVVRETTTDKERVVEKTHIEKDKERDVERLPSAPAVPTPPATVVGPSAEAPAPKKPRVIEETREWVDAQPGRPGVARTVSEYGGVIPAPIVPAAIPANRTPPGLTRQAPGHGIGSDTPTTAVPPSRQPLSAVANVPPTLMEPEEKREKPVWSTNPPHPSRHNSPARSPHAKLSPEPEVRTLGNVPTRSSPEQEPKALDKGPRAPSPEPELRVMGNMAKDPTPDNTPMARHAKLPAEAEKPKDGRKPKEDKKLDDDAASRSSGIDRMGEEYSTLGNLRVTNPDPAPEKPSSVQFVEPEEKNKKNKEGQKAPPVPPPPQKNLPFPPVEPIDGIPPAIDYSKVKGGKKDKAGDADKDKPASILKPSPGAAGDAGPEVPAKVADKPADKNGEEPVSSLGNMATKPDEKPKSSKPDAPSRPASAADKPAAKDNAGAQKPEAANDALGSKKDAEKPVTTLGNMATKDDQMGDKVIKEGPAGRPSAPAAGKSDAPKDEIKKPEEKKESGRMPIYDLVTLPNGQQGLVRTGSIAMPSKPKPAPEPTPQPAPSTGVPPGATQPSGLAKPPAGDKPKPADGDKLTTGKSEETKAAVVPAPPAKDGGEKPASTLSNMSGDKPPRTLPTPPGPAGGSKPPSVVPSQSASTAPKADAPAGDAAKLKQDSPPRPVTPPMVPADEHSPPPSRVMPSMGGRPPSMHSGPPPSIPSGLQRNNGRRPSGRPETIPEHPGTEEEPEQPAAPPARPPSAGPPSGPPGGGTAGPGGPGGAPPSKEPSKAPSIVSGPPPSGPPGSAPPPSVRPPPDHAGPHCDHCCPNEPRKGYQPRLPPGGLSLPAPLAPPAAPAKDGKDEEKKEEKKDETKKEEKKKDEPKENKNAAPAAPPSKPADKPAAAPAKDTDASSTHTVHAEPGPAPPPNPPKVAADKGKVEEKPAKTGKDKGKGDGKTGDDKPAEKAAPATAGVTEAMFKQEVKKAEERDKAAEARHKEEAKKAEEREKAAEARHKALLDAVAKIAAGVAALLETDDLEPANVKKAKEAVTKRRADKAALAKKMEEFLQNILKDTNALKKISDADAKEPGKTPAVKTILEQFQKSGVEQSKWLKDLGQNIMDHNSNQHKLTQDAAKQWAREQVGFNLAGYLDDFCKSIAGEVRSLLKEVGDLREQRRAMYMELADLLLTKGRQSGGDLMAVLPYPTKPPAKPAAPADKKKPEPKKPEEKKPVVPPAWTNFMAPAPFAAMGVYPPTARPLPPAPGGPSLAAHPLPVPPGPPGIVTMTPTVMPEPRPTGGKPLPKT